MGEVDYGTLFGASIGVAILLGIVYLAITAGMIALGIWITYTIIWRSVRRGMREFHGLGPYKRGDSGVSFGPTRWS